jgi:hypothetical protein
MVFNNNDDYKNKHAYASRLNSFTQLKAFYSWGNAGRGLDVLTEMFTESSLDVY